MPALKVMRGAIDIFTMQRFSDFLKIYAKRREEKRVALWKLVLVLLFVQ